MCSRAGCPGGPPSTTSTTDFAATSPATEKAATSTPNLGNHPAFRDNHPVFHNNKTSMPTDSAKHGMRSGSTTSDSASASASAGTGSVVTGTSAQSNKFVGGSHQMSDVKLPGYWTHDKTTELKEMAKNNVDGNGMVVLDPKAAPQGDKCDNGKEQGIFKEETKRKNFLKKVFRRKS